jgi:hypothetical protein
MRFLAAAAVAAAAFSAAAGCVLLVRLPQPDGCAAVAVFVAEYDRLTAEREGGKLDAEQVRLRLFYAA